MALPKYRQRMETQDLSEFVSWVVESAGATCFERQGKLAVEVLGAVQRDEFLGTYLFCAQFFDVVFENERAKRAIYEERFPCVFEGGNDFEEEYLRMNLEELANEIGHSLNDCEKQGYIFASGDSLRIRVK